MATRPRSPRTPPKRRQTPPLPLLAAGTVAVVALLLFFTRGGDSPLPAPGGCAVADVSGSTRDIRDTYAEAFRTFAGGIGTTGSGKVCLIVAAGDPIAEGLPQFADVGPDADHKDSPDLAPVDIKRKVDAATADVSAQLAHPKVGVSGSALLEGASVAAKGLKPGDKLLWLTDGVQNSPAVGDFTQIDLSDEAIARLLNDLQRKHLLPSLTGVEVQMPFLLYHPGGMRMRVERQQQIQKFWQAWATRVGAHLA